MSIRPSSICGVNRLPEEEKRKIYTSLIPAEIYNRFNIPRDLKHPDGRDLVQLVCPDGSPCAEMSLRHDPDFPDPILYGQITDTSTGQILVLFYALNDPTSPRFDVDRLPDGTSTQFGTLHRNLQAEVEAMRFGLAPGQVRRGLRLLMGAIRSFEAFITSLEHDLYFVEPLHYHNAIIFERYGFAYEKGRRLVERIQAGFSPGGDLVKRLDCSTPFRMPEAAESIRLRSWAIYDGILDEPFTNVTMYKRVGKSADLNNCPGCRW